jgi:hypothetical protein
MAKSRFGIFSPVLGEKKDYPSILLDKTVQVENSNILRKYGEIWRRKMREMDLLNIINNCETVWTANPIGDAIVTLSNDAIKGLYSIKIAIDASPQASTMQAYFATGTLDLSSKQKISFWIKNSGAIVVNSWLIGLCNDVAGTNPIDFFGVPAIPSTAQWIPLTLTKIGGGNLGASIKSIAVYSDTTTTGMASNYINLDDFKCDTQTPDTNPILHYHRFVKRSTAAEYILAFTKAHIYCWNAETQVWDLKYTCSGDCTEWDTVSYNDKVIATNNVNKVLVWNTVGNFAPLGSASGIEYATGLYLTKAKYVTTFENYLQLGYTYENGVSHPQRIRWSDIGDETLWMTGDAGSTETEGSDFIKGFKIYAGQLIIFKEKSRIKQWLVSTSEVWNWVKLPGDIGLLSNHSIVEDPDGRVYFLASDFTIREMEAGEISHDIDPIVKLIKPSSSHLVQGVYIEETGEIWWSIPYDNALNNKVITFKLNIQGDTVSYNWGELDLSICAFGDRKGA